MIIQQPNDTIMMMKNQNPLLQLETKDPAEISMGYNQKKAKRVSFCSEVIVTETLHHKNYTKKEKMKCWYIKSDFSQIKKGFLPTIELMEAGEPEQQEHCFRGLENRIIKRALERREIRKEARRAVFREEEFQRIYKEGEEGQALMSDADEAIAARYIIFSKYSAFEAYNMGLMDEVEAFRIAEIRQERTIATLVTNETKALLKNYTLGGKKRRRESQQHNSRLPLSFLFREHGRSFQSYLSCTS